MQPENIAKPENIAQPERIAEPENIAQPENIVQSERIAQPENIEQPENIVQSERIAQPGIQNKLIGRNRKSGVEILSYGDPEKKPIRYKPLKNSKELLVSQCVFCVNALMRFGESMRYCHIHTNH